MHGMKGNQKKTTAEERIRKAAVEAQRRLRCDNVDVTFLRIEVLDELFGDVEVTFTFARSAKRIAKMMQALACDTDELPVGVAMITTPVDSLYGDLMEIYRAGKDGDKDVSL